MIKVILVRLDGTPGDEFRLGACEGLARLFDAHVVGLFLNVLPEPTLADAGTTVDFWTGLLDQARERGKTMEAEFANRLRDMVRSAECRRFDVYPHEQARVTARECRTADVFVGLRLSDTDETLERRDVVEEVLFQFGKAPVPRWRPEVFRAWFRARTHRLESKPGSRSGGHRGVAVSPGVPSGHRRHDRAKGCAGISGRSGERNSLDTFTNTESAPP